MRGSAALAAGLLLLACVPGLARAVGDQPADASAGTSLAVPSPIPSAWALGPGNTGVMSGIVVVVGVLTADGWVSPNPSEQVGGATAVPTQGPTPPPTGSALGSLPSISSPQFGLLICSFLAGGGFVANLMLRDRRRRRG